MAVRQISEHRFPCTTCGSDLRFAPESGKLICDHCGNIEEIVAGTEPLHELDYNDALNAELPKAEIAETRMHSCPNCGAVIELDTVTHSTECPFCGTPVVTDTGLHRQIKPQAVVPFVLSEPQARAAMTRWLGRLWFAPGGLRDYARKGRTMDGIYVPYWTYDADTKSSYRGERGTIYYETRSVRRNGKMTTERVQRIRWRPASGRVARFFDDVLVLASKSLPKRYTDGLAPWQLEALLPYRPDYLAGFRAEGYTIELPEGYTEARTIIDRQIERDIRADIGGDRQRIHDVDTAVSAVTFKHVLLPVWMAVYKYRDRTFRFVVNGQTGSVQGERPWSRWKIVFAVILGAILAAAMAYVAAQNQ